MNPRILALAVGVAIGYVLGARDGRARYDQMKAKVTELWEDPRVVKTRKDVEAYARQQAPIIAEKAEAAAKAAPGVIADSARKTADAAKEVADRTTGIAKDVADRTTVIAKDVAGRTSVVAKDVAGRTTIIAKDVVEKVSDTADDIKTRIDPKKPAELKVEPAAAGPADDDLA